MLKANKAVSEERVTQVVKLLLGGFQRSDIIKVALDPDKLNWNLSTRQIENYIAKAYIAIKKSAIIDRTLELGKATSRLEHLYSLANAEKNTKDCLAVLKEINELLGLKIINLKLEGSFIGELDVHNSRPLSSFNQEELRELAELAKRNTIGISTQEPK